jgi:hypothetical protein
MSKIFIVFVFVCALGLNTAGARASEKVISVNCSESKPRHVLVHDSDSKLWCDAILPGYCHKERFKAAEMSCGKSYANEIAAKGINFLDERTKVLALIVSNKDEVSKVEKTEEKSTHASTIVNDVPESSIKMPIDVQTRKRKLEDELLTISESLLSLRKRRIALDRQALKLGSKNKSSKLATTLSAN